VYRDTAQVLETADMRARLFVQGMGPMNTTPTQFAKLIREDRARWAKVVRERKIEVK